MAPDGKNKKKYRSDSWKEDGKGNMRTKMNVLDGKKEGEKKIREGDKK